MSKLSLFAKTKNFIATHYGENPGKMLIHTGVIGWVLSSVAQVGAIVINDKISNEQKMFLIPQEMADAAVNIVSFYAVTQSFKSLASKLVKTGKWLPAKVFNFLKKNDLAKNLGKAKFDVLKDGKLTPELVEKFKSFGDGVDVVATTVGSIISCNILTPIIRNEIAAKRQKSLMAKLGDKNDVNSTNENILTPNPNFNPNAMHKIKPIYMKDFQTIAYSRYSSISDSLKI